jgi:membrane protease YdiL (CAAX protease family)
VERAQLAAWFHVLYFGVLLPLLVFRLHRKFAGKKKALPDPKKHFRGATIELAYHAGLSVLVAVVARVDVFAFDTSHLVRGLPVGVAFYAAAVLYMRPRWRRAVEKRAPIVSLYMPRDAQERAWWIAVSLLAGIGEEITWRGVQTQLLVPIVGTYAVAALLSALSFGGTHFVQGWRSVLVIAVFALGFQAIVWASGGLYVAMLVHVAYDVTAGLMYGKLGRELGYAIEPNSASAG